MDTDHKYYGRKVEKKNGVWIVREDFKERGSETWGLKAGRKEVL